ncbi:MAG: ABC transporter permease [Bacteroides sp.]|nr:ABC transporter permease [Eubacterium sp.]MCM1418809.1 ABC transporter permease [Roseburia sp.]MCM1462082.1 ABC transporter permease [Bacteroides sp.]
MNAVKRALSGGRAALTVAGIAIGVFSVVLISVLGETGAERISDAMTEMGINSVMVQSQDDALSALGDEDVAVLASIEGVRKAMPLMGSYTEGILLGDRSECMVWGVSEEAREIISLTAAYGRLIDRGDVAGRENVCVIDEEIAEAAYGRGNVVGKTIRLYLGGGYHEFTIAGVARSGVSALRNMLSGFVPRFVYIPYTTMQGITGRESYDKIAVLTEPDADSERIAAEIGAGLEKTRGETDGISVNNLQQNKSTLDDILFTVKLLLSAIAGISLLVSGITVMTTMLANVGERKREIGIKKAIGAKNRTLAAEFFAESLVLTSAGGLFGIAAGFLISGIGCAVLGVKMAADLLPILGAFFAAVLIGAVFSVYPALKAANLSPVEALREG